ncbi:pickpocket protein 28-like [Diabrotica undecimpunctata]|uniref:pickpocket protein 28-like n=1 Tax=Diabrotica undecimpunctata TaxID=50387 RepID=UPI003B63B26C
MEDKQMKLRNSIQIQSDIQTQERLKDHLKEYCRYTSIHGLKYLGETKTVAERVWWVISICLSICFCSYMIYQIIYKYIHYPVIVTFSMKETRLQKIPFPAVTICPRAKISQDYLNLTDIFERKYNGLPITENEKKGISMASQICEFYPPTEKFNVSNAEFYDFLLQSRTELFTYCYYLGVVENCSEIFTPIITEEGICYSFNILDKHDIFNDNNEVVFEDFHNSPLSHNWNVESGYTKREVTMYPRRALRVGLKNALYIVLKTKKSDVEYECALDESGYRVNIDLPLNIPEIGENFISVPLNQRVIAQITPHIIKTSDGVKNFAVSKRECYFESERSLKFFRRYSQANCLLECKTNYTLRECGCVGINMPREPGTRLCLLEKQVCMETAETLFSLYNEDAEVWGDVDDDNTEVNCNCRPTCSDISYGTELSYNSLILQILNNTLREEMDFENVNYSVLMLYFDKSYVETKERNELYGFTDFVSNFGGLLGLFTGFSILSCIEIIYFCSLRLWRNVYQ